MARFRLFFLDDSCVENLEDDNTLTANCEVRPDRNVIIIASQIILKNLKMEDLVLVIDSVQKHAAMTF